MRVGLVSLHGCIRAMKQGWSLANAGHEVHTLCAQYAATHSWNTFTTVSLFHDSTPDGKISPVQLENGVKALDESVDVWHVSNEPNWIFRVVKQTSKKPVVWDIHDWTSLREGGPVFQFELEEESWALDHADGFIVPSEGYLKRIRAISKKPSVLVYSKVPALLFPPESPKSNKGLVYEGGVKGKENGLDYNYAYRNWGDFALKCSEVLGKDQVFDFFTANDGEDFSEYQHPKIHVYPPQVYPALLVHLGQYSAGIVGTPYPLKEFEDSMPNKLFEYVASGIPVLCYNAPEAQRFVEQRGLGLGIGDVSDVPKALENLTGHQIQRDRWGHTLEGELPKLVSLLEEVRCLRNRRVISQMGC